MSSRAKLLILHTHPIQYYAPIYRSLCASPSVELKVIFLSDAGSAAQSDPGFGRTFAWDVDLLAGYDNQVLRPGSSVDGLGFWGRHHGSLRGIIEQFRPDVLLIYGYASRMNWVAVNVAKRLGASVLYFSDSNIGDVRIGFRTMLRSITLKRFFKDIDCFLSPSAVNKTYLRCFGADERLIRSIPFSIEISRFAAARKKVEANQRKYHFAWAGKMVLRKRAEDFIDAIGDLVQEGHTNVRACIIGDGPLSGHLRERIEARIPKGVIEWVGFVNQGEMPERLCLSECLVLTSEREAYGLIATEAAACGMALIVSDSVGCIGVGTPALPHRNALVYPSRDVKELVGAMRTLLLDLPLLRNMQRSSTEISLSFDAGVAAQVIEKEVLRLARND